MPEVTYSTSMTLPPEAIWEFVKDMNNWAPFLTGYQSHEIIDQTDSIWTLKGDVGLLSRTVKLRAHVTEWNGPERVSFTLTGLNEAVEGGGTLLMERWQAEAPAAERAQEPRKGIWRRFLAFVFRILFRSMHGAGPKRLPATAERPPAARLTFTLRMEAGGPSAPLVNALLEPALLPAAEDLANKIAAHLERAPSVRVVA